MNLLKKINPYALFIALLTIVVWYKIVLQTPLGEGYYYFDHGQDFFNNGRIVADLSQNDMFGRIIFDILPPIFGDQLWGYMAFELLGMIGLYISLFFVFKWITKSAWIAMVAVSVSLVSYVGSFEMLGAGNYQRFVQRVPHNIFLFVAFALFAKFLESGNRKLYILSLVLFSTGVFLAHFSTFILPLFIIYPIVWSAYQKYSLKKIIINLMYSFPFLAINAWLIANDSHTPSLGLRYFINEKGIGYLSEQVLLQFASMNIPSVLIEKIASVQSPYNSVLVLLSIPLVLFLFIGTYWVHKRQRQVLPFYVSSLLMIPVCLFLSLYLGKVDPIYNIRGYTYYFLPDFYKDSAVFEFLKGDRYYYIPMIFLGFVWAVLMISLIPKKGKIRTIYLSLLSLLFICYLIYNTSLVWSRLDLIQPLSNDNKIYLNYVKSISSQFNDKTTLVVPQGLIWPSQFIREMYGTPGLGFVVNKKDWEGEISKNNKFLIILDYNYKTKTVSDITKDTIYESRY